MSFRSIETLTPEDQVLFNHYGRGPKVDIPFDFVHAAFESIADKHPKALAARDDHGVTITYGDLEKRANVLANKLIAKGLKPGQRVCLVVSRSIDMVAAILAVLKAGGQYVPLDGGIVSEEALEHILRDTSTDLVLCLRKFREKIERHIPRASVEIINLDHNPALWAGLEERPRVRIEKQSGVYVIYTSGTTGKPKGVDVTHENVTNCLLTEPAKLGITIGQNVAQVLNISFDMAAWEIIATIMNGGTLNIRGRDWSECLRKVDVVISTPTVLGRFRQADFPNLKTVAVGGEPCPIAVAEEWSPYVTFFNICGPTEITILNTMHLHRPGRLLTIGKPNPNNNVYILDDDENPVKIGQPGLMWAGGPSVSKGYLNLPELTATRLKPDKFTRDGRMMFNTGDLGRWLSDGSLEHLGRKDEQVKIKGFRVELDGVSVAMEKSPGVRKACALLVADILWGVYSSTSVVDEEALRDQVSQLLPYYAVPSSWMFLPEIPLTANGKFDKRELKRLIETRSPPESPMTPPTPLTPLSVGSLAPSSTESLQMPGRNIDEEKGLSLVKVSNGSLESVPEKKSLALVRVANGSSESVPDETEDAQYTLPPKNGFHGQRWLRHRFFSLYRRFFSVIFLANLAAFIVLMYQSWGTGSLPIPNLATAVASNLLAAVAMRQDHVINFLFWLATRMPHAAPMCIRRQCARVYHIGGVHSGAAVSATMWWVVFTAAATMNFVNKNQDYPINVGTIVLTYLVMVLLGAICAMAYPSIRMKIHDQFEWTHRFAGWTALAFVWAHLVVATDSLRKEVALSTALAKTPAIYLLALITLSIALPWMRLRKVKVRPEPLSDHAIRLHFDFDTPIAGKAIRITDRPMVEWHAFATIDKPGVKGFSIVVSNAGDWTKKTIKGEPTELWTRGVLASGVLTIAPLFRKVVLVATGSGIGPCLPVILEGRVPARVLWSTPHPVKTFGQAIMDDILEADPKAVIWNTRTQGKPDLAAMSYQMYKESGAEAVCIISNKRVTEQLVYRLEARGIPAFGAIFDS